MKRGQGLVEYALLVALIAVAAILILLFLSGAITTILSSVARAACQAAHTCGRIP